LRYFRRDNDKAQNRNPNIRPRIEHGRCA
jgi:hypothetical protein